MANGSLKIQMLLLVIFAGVVAFAAPVNQQDNGFLGNMNRATENKTQCFFFICLFHENAALVADALEMIRHVRSNADNDMQQEDLQEKNMHDLQNLKKRPNWLIFRERHLMDKPSLRIPLSHVDFFPHLQDDDPQATKIVNKF
ncbi:uncharacterized protein LOC110989954 isoform X1 [Acanthaster planci]|uniref:Uncharacterized protein LOC110989954 isoform X1 n=1 Tax=Acanthaster planci TaxID=133434 RepID=A0A8B7ZXV4_ACAPL|nr:uncharacterized protein LOC110989954 isoform X1 [Acanthaster planci]